MTISHVRVPLLISLAFSLLLGFGTHTVRAVDESPSPEPIMLTTVLVAEPPIESGEEAIAAIIATGAPFAEFALADEAMIGVSATYTVAGDSEVGWKVTFSYGWGDCQAGCISSHLFFYVVDAATGDVRYDGHGGDELATDAPEALLTLVGGDPVIAPGPDDGETGTGTMETTSWWLIGGGAMLIAMSLGWVVIERRKRGE